MILDIVIIVFKYQAGYMQTKLKENEIILNFFGIKLKFKSSINSNFISLNDLKDSWRYNGTNKELISIFKILYNYKSRKKLDDESILIYICSLYELNQKDLAKKILKFHIEDIPVKKIAGLLPVANLAYELGLNDEEIRKSNELFLILEKNKNLLKDFCQNKTIAIVGNGAQEINKNKGKEIDLHDIVIRFNKIYNTTEFQNDYGSKTTIWVKNHETILEASELSESIEKLNKKIDILCLKLDYWHTFANVDSIYKNIKGAKLVTNCYTANEIQIVEEITGVNKYRPTMGYFFAILLSYYCKKENIDFYGFSFLEKNVKKITHLYTKIDNKCMKKIEEFHGVTEEIKILKKIFNEKVEKYR